MAKKSKVVPVDIKEPIELTVSEFKPIPNRINKPKRASKYKESNARPTSFDFYNDIFAPRQIPISLVELERIGLEMVEWALKDPDAYKISQFFHLKGISKDSMPRWRKRSKRFNELYEEALAIIGNRREIGGLKRQLDGGMVALSMPMYDPEWKAQVEWRKTLDKKNEEKQPTTQVVIVDRFPDSPLVPTKSEEK